jgi:hypothetical protein
VGIEFSLPVATALRYPPQDYGKMFRDCNKVHIKSLDQKCWPKKAKAKMGGVTLIQRFGGSTNLNVHFHQLTIDGAYELDENLKPTIIHLTSAPTVPELQSVLAEMVKKITKYLEKSAIIINDTLKFVIPSIFVGKYSL